MTSTVNNNGPRAVNFDLYDTKLPKKQQARLIQKINSELMQPISEKVDEKVIKNLKELAYASNVIAKTGLMPKDLSTTTRQHLFHLVEATKDAPTSEFYQLEKEYPADCSLKSYAEVASQACASPVTYTLALGAFAYPPLIKAAINSCFTSAAVETVKHAKKCTVGVIKPSNVLEAVVKGCIQESGQGPINKMGKYLELPLNPALDQSLKKAKNILLPFKCLKGAIKGYLDYIADSQEAQVVQSYVSKDDAYLGDFANPAHFLVNQLFQAMLTAMTKEKKLNTKPQAITKEHSAHQVQELSKQIIQINDLFDTMRLELHALQEFIPQQICQKSIIEEADQSASNPGEFSSCSFDIKSSCSVEIDLTRIKNTTISPTLSFDNQVEASLNISPTHIEQSTIKISAPISHNVQAGITVNPLHPNTLTASATMQNAQIGVVIPKKLKDAKVTLAGKLGSVEGSVEVNPRRILNSRVSIKVPFNAYGIPVVIGVNGILKNPEKFHLTAEVPTGLLNTFTKPLGMHLPKTIRVASLSLKGVKRLFKRKTKRIKATKHSRSIVVKPTPLQEFENAVKTLTATTANLKQEIEKFSTQSTNTLQQIVAESNQMTTSFTQTVQEFQETNQSFLETSAEINQVPLVESFSRLEQSVQVLQATQQIQEEMHVSMQQNSDLLVEKLGFIIPPELAASMLQEWEALS